MPKALFNFGSKTAEATSEFYNFTVKVCYLHGFRRRGAFSAASH